MNSVKCGTETITFLGAKIWKILPNGYKELTSILINFKSKIKNWETDICPLADYAKHVSSTLVLFD